MNHDVDDEEKLNRLYELLTDDEWDGLLNDFEREFIYNNYLKCQETNYEFSEKQSKIIDECYEKAYKAGCFDD